MNDVTISTTISGQTIQDLFVTAFEGGSTYWVRDADLIESPNLAEVKRLAASAKLVWWGRAEAFAEPFKIAITHDDPNVGNDSDATIVTEIDRVSVVQGLQKMADLWPESLGRISRADEESATEWDANDADTFLQLVVLGEVVFG